MILVDTSIWIDHLHATDEALITLLDQSEVVCHPMVVGELALGRIPNRQPLLDALAGLPQLGEASHSEVLELVERRELYGQGLSLVDAHLIAAVLIAPGTSLWTRDKPLRAAAVEMGIAPGGLLR